MQDNVTKYSKIQLGPTCYLPYYSQQKCLNRFLMIACRSILIDNAEVNNMLMEKYKQVLGMSRQGYFKAVGIMTDTVIALIHDLEKNTYNDAYDRFHGTILCG